MFWQIHLCYHQLTERISDDKINQSDDGIGESAEMPLESLQGTKEEHMKDSTQKITKYMHLYMITYVIELCTVF